MDPHTNLHGQPNVTVLAVIIQKSFSAVFTVRNLFYLLPQYPLGIVHQLTGRCQDRVLAVTFHQFDETPNTQFGRSDLCFDITLQLFGGAAVSTQKLPHRNIADTFFIKLGAGKQHTLGIDIRNIDDQSWCGRTDVKVVSRIRRKTDQLVLIKTGDHNS